MTLSKLLAVVVSFAFLFPASALATKTYAIITGSPSQIPDDEYRYMDANEGCSTVIVPPPDTGVREEPSARVQHARLTPDAA